METGDPGIPILRAARQWNVADAYRTKTGDAISCAFYEKDDRILVHNNPPWRSTHEDVRVCA
jgi:hypothetical protein